MARRAGDALAAELPGDAAGAKDERAVRGRVARHRDLALELERKAAREERQRAGELDAGDRGVVRELERPGERAGVGLRDEQPADEALLREQAWDGVRLHAELLEEERVGDVLECADD